MDHQEPLNPEIDLKEAISYGADFGLKSTCLLSIIYTMIGILAWPIITGLSLGFLRSEMKLLYFPMTCYGGFAILMFLSAPLLIIGALTGALLGAVTYKASQRLSAKRSFFTGIATGVIILIFLLALIYFFTDTPSSYENMITVWSDLLAFTPGQSFWLVYFFPGVVYLLACGWSARYFFEKNRKRQSYRLSLDRISD